MATQLGINDRKSVFFTSGFANIAIEDFAITGRGALWDRLLQSEKNFVVDSRHFFPRFTSLHTCFRQNSLSMGGIWWTGRLVWLL